MDSSDNQKLNESPVHTVRLLFLWISEKQADRSSAGVSLPTSERTCLGLITLMRSSCPLNHSTLVELTYISRLLEQNATFVGVKVGTYWAKSIQSKNSP